MRKVQKGTKGFLWQFSFIVAAESEIQRKTGGRGEDEKKV